MRITRRLILLAGAISVAFPDAGARADALTKLQPDKLGATHQSIQAFQKERQMVVRPGPYQEYRANLHVHSSLSHYSRGTVEEIVAAANTGPSPRPRAAVRRADGPARVPDNGPNRPG